MRNDDISRRHFIGKSAAGLVATAVLGPLPARGGGRERAVEMARSGEDIVLLGNGAEVARLPRAAVAGAEPESPAEFGAFTAPGLNRRFRIGPWSIRDQIDEQEPGVFRWTRSWANTSARAEEGDLRLEAVTAYAPEFFLIPGASYNGNPRHARTGPEGLSVGNAPRIFSAFRATVPAGTYSEGSGWSLFLFADDQRPSLDCGCSLVPQEGHLHHRLLWPGRDNIALAGPAGAAVTVGAGETFSVVAFLVVAPAPVPRKSWSQGLDAAWRRNRRDVRASFPPARVWSLGIEFARRTLWYEEADFTGFHVGLVRKGNEWHRRGEVRFESGWCGQNASLGVAMLQDHLWNHNPDSLSKGLRALDFWAANGRLPCGLFYTHYDVKLGVSGFAPYGWGPYNATFLGRPAKPLERWVDTCNLGYGAYFYLLASELAEKCGVARPEWRQLGLDTCNFFVAHALEDGTFGKAWSLEGRCLAAGATTGSHLIWPILKAYRMTGDPRYLAVARRAFRTYADRDLDQLDCWGSALDADCLDRESGQPLLLAALDLYEITGEQQFLDDAKMAGYYLASWQWHYSVPFPAGSQIATTGYDIFAGTAISVRGPGIDPWGAFLALGWMQLAKATGDKTWLDRGIQSFRQSTMGISDGHLVLNGMERPLGSQNESMGLRLEASGRGLTGHYNDWLVAWPTALRLITLMHWPQWSDLES